jgi:uncharacterized protein YbjT (DUF2867 family)
MRVLVVGGTGFIGAHLCRELDSRGHDVRALSRSPDGAELPPGVETATGDVTAYDSIEPAFESRDAVVNLVALSPLFRPEGGEGRHDEVHRQGTEHVVRAAERRGVPRVVQLSALGADPDGETAYIRAKGEAETAVTGADLEWVIFRPSVVFGDGGEFVPYTKQLAPPYLTPLPGGGETRFQPVWVGDLVPMIADAVEGTGPAADERASAGASTDHAEETTPAGDADSEPAGARAAHGDRPDDAADPHAGRIYEIGGPEVLTLAEIAEMAHGADGRPVEVVSIPMGAARLGLETLEHLPASVLDAVPGLPRMGSDQYRSLTVDNTTESGDVAAFGVSTSELTTLEEYLTGVE